jgi:hypothetical protein
MCILWVCQPLFVHYREAKIRTCIILKSTKTVCKIAKDYGLPSQWLDSVAQRLVCKQSMSPRPLDALKPSGHLIKHFQIIVAISGAASPPHLS